MKLFMDEDFLLSSETARELYHDYARDMPIFDYHCHLPPDQIADNRQFENITQIWLAGDHYKWRAMRTNGVEERYITGDASDKEKFLKWAQTVPATIGNPLYHWTHLELKRPFDIRREILSPDTAEDIWTRTGALLQTPEFTARGILQRMRVRYVGTTDDPVDDLAAHETIARAADFPVVVKPSFRPDRVYNLLDPEAHNAYLDRLSEAASVRRIETFEELRAALAARIDYFHERGCRVSDHAMVLPVNAAYTEGHLNGIIAASRRGMASDATDQAVFTTAVLDFLGREYARRGWVMQLHYGAIRNNNSRMFAALGPDTGFDSIGDGAVAIALAGFLDRLDRDNLLPRTILYNLNPGDNDLVAAMIGNFQDGTVPGKIQFGSGWWFNDQKDGMIRQMTSLANMSLLSRFVGMLTDSRSFLSYPRHEYFRRILSELIGSWVENGEAPKDMKLLGSMVQDICYTNAVRYFRVPGVKTD